MFLLNDLIRLGRLSYLQYEVTSTLLIEIMHNYCPPCGVKLPGGKKKKKKEAAT